MLAIKKPFSNEIDKSWINEIEKCNRMVEL